MAEKGFRENRRITIDEVSRETGIHRNTLSRIVNNKGCNTTTVNLDKLCEFFECSLSDLAAYVKGD